MEGYLVHIFLACAVFSLFNHINPCTAYVVIPPHLPIPGLGLPHHLPVPEGVLPDLPPFPGAVPPHEPVVHHPHQPAVPAVVPNQADIEWVRMSCQITPHPDLCFDSLQMHAGSIRSEPKLIAYTALDVTVEHTKKSLEAVKQFSHVYILKPIIALEMASCGKQLYDAIGDFQKCKDELEGNFPSEGETSADEVAGGQRWLDQAWTSDIQTIEKTCLDGIAQQNLNGPTEAMLRDHVVKVVQLTTNALSLLGGYISTLPDASSHV